MYVCSKMSQRFGIKLIDIYTYLCLYKTTTICYTIVTKKGK